MSRTLEQKIADAEARLQRLKAKSRSLDTAQKVIVGAALLAKVRKPEEVQLRAWLLQFLKAEVTRPLEDAGILPLAASSFPPIARVLRPKVVLFSSKPKMIKPGRGSGSESVA